jgi:hypothetical protein
MEARGGIQSTYHAYISTGFPPLNDVDDTRLGTRPHHRMFVNRRTRVTALNGHIRRVARSGDPWHNRGIYPSTLEADQ